MIRDMIKKRGDATLQKNTLTIHIPKGAQCGLYAGVPATANYNSAIVQGNAIAPALITETGDGMSYQYRDLPEGAYFYGVSQAGFTSRTQVIYYSAEKATVGLDVDVKLSPMAGDGYESGFVMLNSQEFVDSCLQSDKYTWGEQYSHLFATPQFTRMEGQPGHHQQTTNAEIWDFIKNLEKSHDNVYIYTLGKSPKYGFDMPLVLFTRENVSGMTLEQAAEVIRNNGKPTVQYAAQVHSNEPGSTEGALAMMLSLTGDFGKSVLDRVDVYIIPRINLDGAVEVVRHAPATGDDMNRDYLYMHNQEIRMVTGVYNLFLPELVIDGHEKITDIRCADESRCTDMELQVGAGSLNHPTVMTELAMKVALNAIGEATQLGLRGHFYQCLASAAGGAAGSSYYGTRNSLSFLVETPGGTTLGNYCMARRIMGQYILASTVIRYGAENAKEVMETVHASRKKLMTTGTIYDESDVIVLEHGNAPTGSVAVPMIRVLTGEVTDPALDMAYNEQPIAVRSRPRPTAYVLPQGLPDEKEILRVITDHGIAYYCLPGNTAMTLRQYLCEEDEISLAEEKKTSFPEGCIVLPNTVPSTILSVIMEPDFGKKAKRKMTLYSMGLVTENANGVLPIYRYCHDLQNGKVPVIE